MSDAPEARWPLDRARKVAERIREELRPYCAKIEIAGSIRRERPEVGDIDLVLLPREGMEREMRERATAATRGAGARLLANGAENIRLQLANGMQVDLFLARHAQNDLAGYIPGNFGMRLLAMTGSKQHNIHLAKTAEAQGFHFHPYRGLMRGGRYVIRDEGRRYEGGEVFRGEDELEVLRALGLGWIEPSAREVLDR
jgi:DNA polymerase/3'-5' exonuclease PolX